MFEHDHLRSARPHTGRHPPRRQPARCCHPASRPERWPNDMLVLHPPRFVALDDVSERQALAALAELLGPLVARARKTDEERP